MAEFKMSDIIKLSGNELVWDRVREEWECYWVNLKEDNNVSESSWVTINEWSFFLLKIVESNMADSRWLTSSSWVRMNEFESDWISLSQSFVQNGWIKDGRIQDGCHHQINQIELVWVRVRVEWECYWVNLREDNKVSESKMAVYESNLAEFKLAAIIKLSQNEWVEFILCKWLNPRW